MSEGLEPMTETVSEVELNEEELLGKKIRHLRYLPCADPEPHSVCGKKRGHMPPAPKDSMGCADCIEIQHDGGLCLGCGTPIPPLRELFKSMFGA